MVCRSLRNTEFEKAMSTSNMAQRPAFHSLDDGPQFDRPPVSRLAYVALAAGIFSLLAAFSTILLPAAMLAMAVGIAVVWKLSRDQQLGGRWLAQIGLALSATAIAWSISARGGVDDYMYAEAGQHAKLFLDTLSAGNKYEALELKQVESARQLTGTNLSAYYNGLEEEQKQMVQEFLDDPVTKSIVLAGPQADWQFKQGVSVTNQEKQYHVTVEMVNQAAQGNPQVVHVRLGRQLGLLTDPEKRDSTALWNFEQLTRPKT